MALPVNEFVAMLLTPCLASAHSLKQAFLADQVLRLGFYALCILTLTVNETTKVWLVTFVAQVEGASVHGELQWLAIVVISTSREPFVL